MGEVNRQSSGGRGRDRLLWGVMILAALAVWAWCWVPEWRYARGPYKLAPLMAWLLPTLFDLLPLNLAYGYVRRRWSGLLTTSVMAVSTVLTVGVLHAEHAADGVLVAAACLPLLILGFAAVIRADRDQAAEHVHATAP